MKKGFTLIELLIVIALVAFMSAIAILNFPALRASTAVRAEAQRIIDKSIETRQKSLAVEAYNANFPSYGIYFNKAGNYFLVFADCRADDNGDLVISHLDNFRYNEDETSTDCQTGRKIEKIQLGSGVTIKEIKSKTPKSGSNTEFAENQEDSFHVEYLRPEPTVWMSNSSHTYLPVASISVKIGDKSNTYFKTIVFESTGQFYVQ